MLSSPCCKITKTIKTNQEYKIKNYFNSDVDFQSLPLRTKVLNLLNLCDFRLDSEDVQLIFNDLESESVRVEPLGFDSKGSTYWYFYGTRLYREDKLTAAEKKKRKATANSAQEINGNNITKSEFNIESVSDTVWQVICFTEEDWNNLAAKLKSSPNAKERHLHTILEENFLPKIPSLFRKKELLRRRR